MESLPEDRGEVRGVDVWTNDGILIADGQTVNRIMLSPAGYKAMVKSGLFDHAVVVSHDLEKRMTEMGVLDAKPKSQRNLRDDVYDPSDDFYYHWHITNDKRFASEEFCLLFFSFFPAVKETQMFTSFLDATMLLLQS